MIELTEEQRSAVRRGEPVRIPSPEFGEDLVLISATTYEEIREALAEESQRRVIARIALENAYRRMDETPG